MYQWLKIGQTIRLPGELAADDFQISNWEDLGIRFIVEVEVETKPASLVRVDFFPFFFELLKASLVVSTGKLFTIVIGEGWEMNGMPTVNGYNIEIGFELSEMRKPVLSRQLSQHETMLFIAMKLAEMVWSLRALGVNAEEYFSQFPPSEYRTGLCS